MTGRPESGLMIYWRFRQCGGVWRFGFVSDASSGLIRLGYWHGDTSRGPVVDPDEIEWRPHR
jgi:hypothetical protein